MKRSIGVAFLSFLVFDALLADSIAVAAAETDSANSKTSADEFLELAEPQKNISGAYVGLGLTLSMISHKLKVEPTAAGANDGVDFKKSKSQFDLSLIGGFGAAFYKMWYAGIEAELFQRLGGGTSYEGRENESFGVVHNSTMGLNMDVRLGYLFPEQGCLAYVTVGFARVLGRVAVPPPAPAADAAAGQGKKASFGSFYPTFGVGVEYKMNHLWSVRGDIRYSITSKDDGLRLGERRKGDAKPSRIAFRASIIRSI